MHTIIVHLDKKLHDWHLIEPFFYKGQSMGKLSFLEAPIRKEGVPLFWQLEEELYDYLYQHAIDDWQLIFIMNNAKANTNRIRLNYYLYQIKDKVLSVLKNKRLIPVQTSFFIIDPLQRNGDFSPIEDVDDIYWQLDTNGYFSGEEQSMVHNMFTKNEIALLDQAWGEPVDLSFAGLMDHPKEAFLGELQKKAASVMDKLEQIMSPKYTVAGNYHNASTEAVNEIIPKNILNDIYSDFKERLQQTITPVLSDDLATFKPSNLVKRILKNRVAIKALLTDFHLIRMPFRIYSSYYRTVDLIQVAIFLHMVAMDASLIRQAPKGVALQLELEVDSEQLQQMLQNNYLCLEDASHKVESQILDSIHSSVHRYSDIKVDSVYITSHAPFESSGPKWNYQNGTGYKPEFQAYTEKIKHEIGVREKALFESVHKEVAKLTVAKRQDLDDRDYDEEKVELTSHLDELDRKLEQSQHEMSKLSPDHQQLQTEWNDYEDKKKRKLAHLFTFFPNHRMVGYMYLIIGFALLFPYYKSIAFDQLEWSTFRFWGSTVLVPILLIVLSLVIGLIVRKRLRKPIEQLIDEVETTAKEYSIRLEEMPKVYEQFLKKLYRLFQIRKQYSMLKDEAEQLHHNNVLVRYHQGQLAIYIEKLAKVLRLLKVDGYDWDQGKCQSFVEKSFDPMKAVQHNPIYSPLDCLFNDQVQSIEVEIRGAKLRSTLDIYPLVKSIKLKTDKVYNV